MTLLLTCTHKHTPYSHLSSFSPHIFIHLCIPPVIIRPASFPPTLNSLLPPSLGINPSTFIYLPPLLPLFLLHPLLFSQGLSPAPPWLLRSLWRPAQHYSFQDHKRGAERHAAVHTQQNINIRACAYISMKVPGTHWSMCVCVCVGSCIYFSLGKHVNSH